MNASVSPLLHAGAAVVCLAWVALILVAGRGRTAWLLAGACAIASAWAVSVAIQPEAPLTGLAGGVEIFRSLAWLGVLLGLSGRAGFVGAGGLMWRFALAGVLAAVLAFSSLLPDFGTLSNVELAVGPTLGSPALLAPMGLALLVVLAAENLYRNASEAGRWHVILPCITLGGLSAFDVLLHADAALSRGYASSLLDARAALTALAMPLLAIAAMRDRRWRRKPVVSRQAVFHGTTLVIAGTFLIGVGAAGEALRHLGANWAHAAQASLLAGALMMIAVATSSRSMRSWLRGLVVDHFFAARFDYRREWLRCVATLSSQEAPPQIRAITAIADAVDSHGGLLLLREAGRPGLHWAGSWNLPESRFSLAGDHPVILALREGTWVTAQVPLDGGYWLGVPLLHHSEGMLGVVLLTSPRAAFALDGEVFDLLRALGREVAMFVAERKAAEDLTDTRRLRAYAQRFAFVAHDVKTVASQLTMLLSNAAEHIDDPEFQADMLLTVEASAARINALIARLRQPPDEEAQDPPLIAPLERLRELVREHAHPIVIKSGSGCGQPVAMAAAQFDAALRHLLDNAAEASPAGVPVSVEVGQEGDRLTIAITDRGSGMSAEFIRDTLFRPFLSGRAEGNGIGAWQARDLLRSADGDLAVFSAAGAGTTMRITLPLRQARPTQDAALQECAA